MYNHNTDARDSNIWVKMSCDVLLWMVRIRRQWYLRTQSDTLQVLKVLPVATRQQILVTQFEFQSVQELWVVS
jgi:hypothetical protein